MHWNPSHFTQAATTGLWESRKEELKWEKMENLLTCGKLRTAGVTSSVEEEAEGPEDMVHAKVKDDQKSFAWVNSLAASIITT